MAAVALNPRNVMALAAFLSFLQERYQGIADARASNATRRLANNANQHLPGIAESLQDTLESQRLLNMFTLHAREREVQAFQALCASAAHRDQIEAWARVVDAETFRLVAADFSAMASRVGAGADAVADNLDRIGRASETLTRDVHDVRIMGNSLLDRLDLYGSFLAVVAAQTLAEIRNAVRALQDISAHLGDHNAILVSGSAGPEGFARHVYDLITMRVDETHTQSQNAEQEEAEHMFFVYHPDTNWWPAFARLVREQPLPAQFCAKSADLDRLCQLMQHARGILAQRTLASSSQRETVFHLLVPAWTNITISEPLHFPDDLHPFRVEGTKHKGQPLVQFNLPRAPAGMLNDVANKISGQNGVARGVSAVVATAAAGWGANGACLATGIGLGALTGLGLLVMVPVWVGSAMVAMPATAEVVDSAVYNALREDPPRILGSLERLET